jgi:monoterpene epsilon-lactone hydrolase
MSLDEKRPPLEVGPRTVPIPTHISQEAQQMMASPVQMSLSGDYPPLDDKPAWKEHIAGVNGMMKMMDQMALSLCPVEIEHKEVNGVRLTEITPPSISTAHADRVLMNIHGGAFVYGEGMIAEAVVAAYWGEINVVAVDYRVPPDHPFPANLEDTVGGYRALLEKYDPNNIAIYGTSAGGTYTTTTVLKLRELGLPLPAAAGILTPACDLSEKFQGDSTHTNEGVDSVLSGAGPEDSTGPQKLFAGDELENPLVSPIFADFGAGFCPSYFLTGTRDFLLSSTVLLHRALHGAGVPCELHVYEAMSHGFNVMPHLPEAREATLDMIRFFDHWMDRAR